MDNPVITSMLNRKSVRKYTRQQPGNEVIEALVRAGQQAPFAAQMYSTLFAPVSPPSARLFVAEIYCG